MKTTEHLALLEKRAEPALPNGHLAMPEKPEPNYIRFAELPDIFKEKGLMVKYDDLYNFVLRHNRRKKDRPIKLRHLPDRGGRQITKEDADLIFDMYINPEKYID